MQRDPAIRVMLLPRDTNGAGTIFGGAILSHLDLAGAIEALDEAIDRDRESTFVSVDKLLAERPVTEEQLSRVEAALKPWVSESDSSRAAKTSEAVRSANGVSGFMMGKREVQRSPDSGDRARTLGREATRCLRFWNGRSSSFSVPWSGRFSD